MAEPYNSIEGIWVDRADLPWMVVGADTNKRYYILCDLLNFGYTTPQYGGGFLPILCSLSTPAVVNENFVYQNNTNDKHYIRHENFSDVTHIHLELRDELMQRVLTSPNGDWSITLILVVALKE